MISANKLIKYLNYVEKASIIDNDIGTFTTLIKNYHKLPGTYLFEHRNANKCDFYDCSEDETPPQESPIEELLNELHIEHNKFACGVERFHLSHKIAAIGDEFYNFTKLMNYCELSKDNLKYNEFGNIYTKFEPTDMILNKIKQDWKAHFYPPNVMVVPGIITYHQKLEDVNAPRKGEINNFTNIGKYIIRFAERAMDNISFAVCQDWYAFIYGFPDHEFDKLKYKKHTFHATMSFEIYANKENLSKYIDLNRAIRFIRSRGEIGIILQHNYARNEEYKFEDLSLYNLLKTISLCEITRMPVFINVAGKFINSIGSAKFNTFTCVVHTKDKTNRTSETNKKIEFYQNTMSFDNLVLKLKHIAIPNHWDKKCDYEYEEIHTTYLVTAMIVSII